METLRNSPWFILVAFAGYGVVHSLMASLGFKDFVYALMGDLAERYYRLVYNIFSGSPAQKAGLQTGDQVLQIGMFQIPVGGDIVVAVDDRSVSTYKDLVVYLESNTEIGDTVMVAFYRDNKKMTRKMKVAERPKQMSIKKITPRKQALR